MTATAKTPRDRWLFGLLLAVLFWLPLPWGSNTETATAFAGLAFALLLFFRLALQLTGGVPKPAIAWYGLPGLSIFLWLLWLLWIALQIMPMDAALVQFYSPVASAIQEASENPLTRPDQLSPSIAPGLTTSALITSASYFALYVLVLFMVNSQKRIALLLWTLVLSGLFQAIYGMHMTLTGLEYGFIDKKIHNIGRATGTFVNPNHFAAYMELTLAAGIGIVLSDLGRWQFGSWRDFFSGLISLLLSNKFRGRITLIALVAALILTRSRMGNIAFFVSLCSCGLLFTLLRYRRWFLPSMLLFGSLLVIDLMVVSHWFGLEAVVQRIEKTELETEGRMIVLKDLQPVIHDYRMTGAGLGTFALAYSPYRKEEIKKYFDHAHNEYAQFMIETGVIGCGLLGLLLLTHIFHCIRIMVYRRTTFYAAVAFTGLMSIVAMSVHATAEFLLRIPAVAATFVTLLALAMSVSSQSRANRPRSSAPEEALEPEAELL